MRDMFKYTLENDTTAMDPAVIEGYHERNLRTVLYNRNGKERVDNTKQKQENISSLLQKNYYKEKCNEQGKSNNDKQRVSHRQNTRKLG